MNLLFCLDEKIILLEDHKDKPLESREFNPETRIEGFPIRELEKMKISSKETFPIL